MRWIIRWVVLPVISFLFHSCCLQCFLSDAGEELVLHTSLSGDADINLLWQQDWQSEWHIDWDSMKYGNLSYTAPSGFLVECFSHEDASLVGQVEFAGSSVSMDLPGGCYDLLSYNAEARDMVMAGQGSSRSFVMTTDRERYVVLPDTLTSRYDIRRMPVEVFSAFLDGVELSDDNEEYAYEEVTGTYTLHLSCQLSPRVFIYLIQLSVRDEGRRVINAGTAAVSGLSSSVDLVSGALSGDAVTHQVQSVFQPPSRTVDGVWAPCLVGSRLLTFGRAAGGSVRNFYHVPLYLSDGSCQWLTFDITSQMKLLPTGGVIVLECDAPDVGTDRPSGGGWNIGVGGWHTENHGITI